VRAVVGIDPTMPRAKAGIPQPTGGGINWGRILAVTGVVRLANTIYPDLAEPTSDAYTADERRRMRLMSIWNFGNPAVADEINRLASNASELHGVTYPDSLPVLDLLASETVSTTPGWVQRHEDQLRNVRRHRIVVLEGGHYLHWTQSKAMAAIITDFIGTK
jgi:pimeloyl-ACP methyl ester carboxylesterase